MAQDRVGAGAALATRVIRAKARPSYLLSSAQAVNCYNYNARLTKRAL
ncbi:MAG: hypothetical protein U0T74_12870 [Chitinophagales bacterium]